MAYKSKFTGLQIDNILDSVEGKQNEIEDLESIRSGAAKGATALQSYTEQYKGTITGVSANGTSVATSGVANIPAASTSTYGVTKLSSATNSTSTSLAATASAVKSAYDLANGKQDRLVSGTNIKTINGTSLLGSGDIVISSGSGSISNFDQITVGSLTIGNDLRGWSGPTILSPNGLHLSSYNADTNESGMIWLETLHTFGVTCSSGELYLSGENGIKCDSEIGYTYDPKDSQSDWYWKITPEGDAKFNDTHITGNLTVDGDIIGAGSSSGAYSEVNHGTSDTTFTLTPNTFHVWDEVTSLTLDFGSETSGVANEFLFQFTSGSTATSLTLPDDIKWANDAPPTIEPNMIYQVSILKGLASVLEFSNAEGIFPTTLIEGDNSETGVYVYVELQKIAGAGSGTLSEGDLYVEISGTTYPVTQFFYISLNNHVGYVLRDTGLEYYYLNLNGSVQYYFYD